MPDGCRVAGSQPTIPVYEENGKVKRGLFDVSVNVNSTGILRR